MSKFKNIYFRFNKVALTFRSGTRFPRAWLQPPRRSASAGSLAQAFPAGVSRRRSKPMLTKGKKPALTNWKN